MERQIIGCRLEHECGRERERERERERKRERDREREKVRERFENIVSSTRVLGKFDL